VYPAAAAPAQDFLFTIHTPTARRRAYARRHIVVRRVSGASRHRYPPASPAAAD